MNSNAFVHTMHVLYCNLQGGLLWLRANSASNMNCKAACLQRMWPNLCPGNMVEWCSSEISKNDKSHFDAITYFYRCSTEMWLPMLFSFVAYKIFFLSLTLGSYFVPQGTILNKILWLKCMLHSRCEMSPSLSLCCGITNAYTTKPLGGTREHFIRLFRICHRQWRQRWLSRALPKWRRPSPQNKLQAGSRQGRHLQV